MRKLLSKKSDVHNILECESLRKSFGRVRALDGLDFAVRLGDIHGFLGPNGAGKTTTIRAILGQCRLDGGSIRVLGLDPLRDIVDVHRAIGYVPGDTAFWPNLTGGECIDLLGRLRGSHDSRRRDELVDRFELDPTRRMRGYSKGNRQKVALIAALACRADLFLLDEPTSGLDPVMEDRFLRTIREERDRGATVVLSSHIMSEVDALCDSVTIVKAGRTAYSGSLANLRARASVRIRTCESDGKPRTLNVPHSQADETLAGLLANGASVIDVDRSMDRIFLGFYGQDER